MRPIFKLLIAYFILLGMPTALAASLSLDTVLNSVDSHYPWVIGAVQDLEKAKGDLTSAQGGFDPVLKTMYQTIASGEYENHYFDLVLEQPTTLWGARVFSGYRNGSGQFAPYDERLLTTRDGEVRAGLEFPLLRGGFIDERRARIVSGKKGLDISKAQLNIQQLDARRQASYRYFDWIASGEKLRISQKLLELAIDRDRILRRRVTKGDAAQIEQVDNQRSLAQRESSLISAQRALEKAALELSLFYRDSNGNPTIPSPQELPEELSEKFSKSLLTESLRPHPDESVSIAQQILPQHPEFLRLQSQFEQNEIDRGLAKNSILPKLDAEFLTSQDIPANQSKKSIFEVKAAVKLEFPLFLRSGRGKFDATSAQSAKLETQLELVRDRIRVAIQDSLQAMAAARNRVDAARREVELSLQVEKAERLKFQQGDSTILTVNLRETSTSDARIRVVDALVDDYRARADFLAATAGQILN